MADGALSGKPNRSLMATLSSLIQPLTTPTTQVPKGVKPATTPAAPAKPEIITGRGQDTFSTQDASLQEARALVGDDPEAQKAGVARAATRYGAARLSQDPNIDPDERRESGERLARDESRDPGASAQIGSAARLALGKGPESAAPAVADKTANIFRGQQKGAPATAQNEAAGPTGAAPALEVKNGAQYLHELRAAAGQETPFVASRRRIGQSMFAPPSTSAALLGGGAGVRASDFAIPPDHPGAHAWRRGEQWIAEAAHGLGVIPAIGREAARIGFYSALVRDELN